MSVVTFVSDVSRRKSIYGSVWFRSFLLGRPFEDSCFYLASLAAQQTCLRLIVHDPNARYSIDALYSKEPLGCPRALPNVFIRRSIDNGTLFNTDMFRACIGIVGHSRTNWIDGSLSPICDCGFYHFHHRFVDGGKSLIGTDLRVRVTL